MALQLVIVTPEGEAFSGDVETVVLPGAEGEFGVLERHERFLAPLSAGPLEVRESGESRHYAVASGFADVSAEQVVVLVDWCQAAEAIDADEAERRRDALRGEIERLSGADENELRRNELLVEHEEADVLARVSRLA